MCLGPVCPSQRPTLAALPSRSTLVWWWVTVVPSSLSLSLNPAHIVVAPSPLPHASLSSTFGCLLTGVHLTTAPHVHPDLHCNHRTAGLPRLLHCIILSYGLHGPAVCCAFWWEPRRRLDERLRPGCETRTMLAVFEWQDTRADRRAARRVKVPNQTHLPGSRSHSNHYCYTHLTTTRTRYTFSLSD